MKIKETLLLIIFVTLLLSTLSSVSVFGSSEAREIHLSALIRESDAFILVPKRGEFVPSKPPLYHYISGSIGKILPTSIATEVITRSVSLFSALLTIFLTFLIAKKFSSSPIIAVLVLISSHLFLSSGFDSKVDTLMSLFIVSGIYFWLSGKNYLFITALILGMLTKGPLTVILTSLGLLCIDRNYYSFNSKKILHLGVFLGIGAALGCVWYLLVFISGDTDTITRQLWFENVARLIGDEKIAEKPWYFLFKSFVLAEPHLVLLVILAFIMDGFKIQRKEVSRCGIFFLLTLIFLSFSSGKRSSYILPVLPFFAVWLGDALGKIFYSLSDNNKRKLFLLGLWGKRASISFLVIMLFGYEFLRVFDLRETVAFLTAQSFFVQHAVPFQILIIFTIFSSLYFTNISRNTIYALNFITLWVCLSWAGAGVKGELRGFENASKDIKKIVGDKKIFLIRDRFDEYLDPLFYYLRNSISTVPESSEYILAKKSDVPKESSIIFSHRQIGDIRSGSFEREVVLTSK